MWDSSEVLVDLLVVVFGSSLTAVLGWLIRRSWRKLREREQWYRVVQQLATGVQIGYFEDRLGRPAFATRATDGQTIRHDFVLPEFYVQAVTDGDGQVGFFAVTTRTKKFAPTLGSGGGYPMIEVRLGRDTFSTVRPESGAYVATMGARRFGYSESHYLGNPGRYLTYVLAFNDAGYISTKEFGTFIWTLQGSFATPDAKSVAHQRLRESCNVNTYGEVGMSFVAGPVFGVDKDAVRVLD